MILDKEKIPRGPYFIQEPQPVIFDPNNRKLVNDVALKCVASGYPAPIYKWYSVSIFSFFFLLIKNFIITKIYKIEMKW